MKQNNRSVRRILCAILTVVMLLSMYIPVHAASNATRSVTSLSQGVTVKGTGYSNSKFKLYKISIPSMGFITFRNNYYKKSAPTFWIYKNANDILNYPESYYRYVPMYFNKTQITVSVPVTSGTYYVYPGPGSFSFRYSYTKQTPNTLNYKKRSAITLSSNKPVYINALEKHHQDRWYTFKLTKKQNVTIFFKDMKTIGVFAKRDPIFKLYNSSSNALSYSKKSGFNYTFNNLPEGTYHILVSPSKTNATTLYKLKWS